VTFPTRDVGIGAKMMVGFQPDEDLMVDPPLAGSMQAITGKATATSPLMGTVVGGVAPPAVDVDVTPVDVVVPSSDVPQPASSPSPATDSADRCLRMRQQGTGDGRSSGGIRVIAQTIGPHTDPAVGNRCPWAPLDLADHCVIRTSRVRHDHAGPADRTGGKGDDRRAVRSSER